MARSQKCPYCGHDVSQEQYRAIFAKIEEEAKVEAEKAREAAEQRLAAEKKKAEQNLAAEKRKAEQEIARQQRAAEQKLRQESKAAAAELRRLKAEAGRLDGERQKTQKERDALLTAQRKLKEDRKVLRLQLVKKLAEQYRKKIETAREEQKGKDADALRKATSREDQLRRKVEDLSRKLASKTPDEFGSWQEEQLADDLKSAFPVDVIKRIGKGRKGADVTQTVIENGRDLGTIVYESKNVAKWSNDFVDKAKSYQRDYKTPYVVIVSTAFPRKERDFCVLRKDISVVSPSKAIHLARILRQAVVEIGKLQSRDMRQGKVDALYRYVGSQEFRRQLAGLGDVSSKLRELQDKEKRTHEGHWKKQQRYFEAIEECRRKIDVDITDILDQEPELRKEKVLRLASRR